jgi:hypothetical protein
MELAQPEMRECRALRHISYSDTRQHRSLCRGFDAYQLRGRTPSGVQHIVKDTSF